MPATRAALRLRTQHTHKHKHKHTHTHAHTRTYARTHTHTHTPTHTQTQTQAYTHAPSAPPPCSFARKIPDKLKQLVEACWAADYEARPEFTDVIKTLEEVLKELPPDPPRRAGQGCSCAIM